MSSPLACTCQQCSCSKTHLFLQENQTSSSVLPKAAKFILPQLCHQLKNSDLPCGRHVPLHQFQLLTALRSVDGFSGIGGGSKERRWIERNSSPSVPSSHSSPSFPIVPLAGDLPPPTGSTVRERGCAARGFGAFFGLQACKMGSVNKGEGKAF